MGLNSLNKKYKSKILFGKPNNSIKSTLKPQIDKKILGAGSKGLIQSIFNDYSFTDSANFVNDIQAIATEYMKLSSYSVGISDLIADDNTNDKINTQLNKRKKK